MATPTAIVPGSLAALARQENIGLAESFLSADAVVLIDVSGSMDSRAVDYTLARARQTGRYESPPAKSHYELACAELERLQAQLPGKIAVVAFSDRPEFAPGGVPRFIGGGTDLARALAFVHVADGCGIRLIVISDGHPDDAAAALNQARRFQSRIDTIYIGPEGGAGAAFLRELADASGGLSSINHVQDVGSRVEQLLLVAGA